MPDVITMLPIDKFTERVVALFREHNITPVKDVFISDDGKTACCVGILAIDAGYAIDKKNIQRPEDFLFTTCNFNRNFICGLSKGFNDITLAKLLKRPTPLFCPYGGSFELSQFDSGWDYGRAVYDRLVTIGYNVGNSKK